MFSKDKNYFGSPIGKSGSKELLLLNSPPGINEFEVLRDCLRSYASSDSSSSYGALVIPESTFDDVVAVVAV